jgi:phosphoribosyl-dephospho-CoA transferase
MSASDGGALAGPVIDARPLRPHDLLLLRRLRLDADAPDWLQAAFSRTPFAVVRRAPSASGCIAIGVRGATRAQRFGTWTAAADIEAAFAPEHLTTSEPADGRSALPAFAALARLRDTRSTLHDFAWGPTGSAGFELASRTLTVNESSDLDLLIRMPDRSDTATIRALARALGDARIDAQLETPAGGVALAELAAGKPRVLARSASGARFVADPWDAA